MLFLADNEAVALFSECRLPTRIREYLDVPPPTPANWARVGSVVPFSPLVLFNRLIGAVGVSRVGDDRLGIPERTEPPPLTPEDGSGMNE
ncbi:hypothetical protein EV182_006865, partial [Spiromyces aspiralis]